MFEDPSTLIILAIISGAVIFKLFSVLGDQEFSDLETKISIDDGGVIDLKKDDNIVDKTQEFYSQINQIRKKIPNFSLNDFLTKAENAFELIIKSFNNNDKKTLESLLEKKLFENFSKAIDSNIKQDLSREIVIISIASRVTQIVINKTSATIFVEFTTEQMIKNKDSSTQTESNIINNWTFSRDFATTSPVWFLNSVEGA